MNLRDNRFFKINFFLVLSLLSITACKESKNIGKEVQPSGIGLDVFLVDSFDIETSTVLIDSLNTRYSPNLLFGTYQDPEIGTISAQAYTDLLLSTNNLSFDAGSVCDSMNLYFLGFGYYYGDTSSNVSLDVYRLAAPLDTSIKYTNRHSSNLDASPLASVTFAPHPRRLNDTLKISLPTSLGQEIVAASGTTALENSYNFNNQLFRGLSFKTSGTTNCVLGVPTNVPNYTKGWSYVRLFYHVGNDATKKFKDFYFSSSNYRYNSIISTFAGQLSSLQKGGDSVSTNSTNNVAYIQAGTGLATKIKLKELETLKNLKGNIIISKADLEFNSDVKFTQSSKYNYAPPSALALFKTNNTNKIVKNSSGVVLTVQQEYQTNLTTPTTAFYADSLLTNASISVTSYLQDLIYNPQASHDGLLIFPTSQSSTLNRYIIYDRKSNTKPLKLKIYYTKIK